MSPIDLAIGFVIGLAAGVILRGALNDAFGTAAARLAPDEDDEDDEDDLAAWGGGYPRIQEFG